MTTEAVSVKTETITQGDSAIKVEQTTRATQPLTSPPLPSHNSSPTTSSPSLLSRLSLHFPSYASSLPSVLHLYSRYVKFHHSTWLLYLLLQSTLPP